MIHTNGTSKFQTSILLLVSLFVRRGLLDLTSLYVSSGPYYLQFICFILVRIDTIKSTSTLTIGAAANEQENSHESGDTAATKFTSWSDLMLILSDPERTHS